LKAISEKSEDNNEAVHSDIINFTNNLEIKAKSSFHITKNLVEIQGSAAYNSDNDYLSESEMNYNLQEVNYTFRTLCNILNNLHKQKLSMMG
jgi:hypothetical protein